MTTEDARDLDETRRLLYMAMAASVTERYELVGTLTNALKHHVGVSEDTATLFDRLVGLVNDGRRDDCVWAAKVAVRLTGLLAEAEDA